MDKNNANDVAAQKEVEADTTQASSPQAEEPSTEVQTDKTDTQGENQLPESSDDQRKAFQEMRQELKTLREQTKNREQSESVFNSFKPQATGNVDANTYADPVTGEINWNAYNTSVRAEAQAAAREEIDEYQARQKHPDLFKDPEIEKEIAAMWFFEKSQGRNMPITQIADKVATRFNKAVSKAEKAGADKMLMEVGAKEQAGLEASTQSGTAGRQAATIENYDQLREASRRGNVEAIVKRFNDIPWANK